jgi:hypothetical protein
LIADLIKGLEQKKRLWLFMMQEHLTEAKPKRMRQSKLSKWFKQQTGALINFLQLTVLLCPCQLLEMLL